MQLNRFFTSDEIHQNGEFQDLGYSNHVGYNILTFCDNVNYLQKSLNNTHVSAIIITPTILKQLPKTNKGVIIHSHPRKKFFELYNHMRDNTLFINNATYEIADSSTIAKSAVISKKSSIGKNSTICENVVIKDNVFIGENCYIDVGTIIGNEGILYTSDDAGNNLFIKHAGAVVIEDSVTLLSNSVVVKSLFPNMPTKIGHHSIIGIATTIGHEVNISDNCKILGNCVVAKNASIGSHSIIGSSSVIRENLTLGKNVDVKAGSIVVKNIKDSGVVSGNFAIKHTLNVKNYFKNSKE